MNAETFHYWSGAGFYWEKLTSRSGLLVVLFSHLPLWEEHQQCQSSTQAGGLQLDVHGLRLTFSLLRIQHHDGDVGEVLLLCGVRDSKLEDVSPHL